MKRPRRSPQRGFTLVELMIAVSLSGIVVAMVFQIHLQLVDAFDGQVAVSEVVDRVTAGRSVIVREARMAGVGMPASGITAPDGSRWDAIEVDNDVDGTGVDQLTIRRVEGTVYTVANNAGIFAVANAADEGFAVGEAIVITTYAVDSGCAAIPSAVDNTHVTVSWVANPSCAALSAASTLVIGRLSQVAFRLDPDEPDEGILERSATAGASDDWEPYGLGFSNLQFAIRMSETADPTDADGDGNAALDWYSGDNQEAASAGTARPASGVALQLGISIEARNIGRVGGAVSVATLPLTDVASPENNALGDWGQDCPHNTVMDPCGADLMNTSGTDRPVRYQGDHVYRASSTRVWLRNQAASL
jgi:prepilin-type N-terminal cleavage/methylation domain-containing protein